MSWKNPHNSWGTPYNGPGEGQSWYRNGNDIRRGAELGESWTSWRNSPTTRHTAPRPYEAVESRPRPYDDRNDRYRQYDRRNEETRTYRDKERHLPYNRRDDRRDDRNRHSDRRELETDNRQHERQEKNERKSLDTNDLAKDETPETLPTKEDEPSTINEPEQSPPEQEEAGEQGNDTEGIKSASSDVVILKPDFDELHFFGVKRGRGGYRGGGPPRGGGGYQRSFPQRGPDDSSASWVSQYFDRVQRSRTDLLPHATRLPPPSSSSRYYPEEQLSQNPPHESDNFGGLRDIGISKVKADLFESSANRRMVEWERFKNENGDDPHQFIETLSDVDEKETWYQILDLVGNSSDEHDKKSPTSMPPLPVQEPTKRALLGPPPSKGRLSSSPLDAPSFFRHEIPSVRPGLYTKKDDIHSASRGPIEQSVPKQPKVGILGRGPGRFAGERESERPRPAYNPYGDAYHERYGAETRPFNGPTRADLPTYESSLPSQLELLERNRELEAQLRFLQSMQHEGDMPPAHFDRPRRFESPNPPMNSYHDFPDHPPFPDRR